MALRKYNRFDLLRFKKFADENKGVSPLQLLRDYDVKYPELSAKQQLENLYAALDMNEAYKNLTGHDIPESARWQIDSDEPEANDNIPHVNGSASDMVIKQMKEALLAVRKHGLIEKDGYDTVVRLMGKAIDLDD